LNSSKEEVLHAEGFDEADPGPIAISGEGLLGLLVLDQLQFLAEVDQRRSGITKNGLGCWLISRPPLWLFPVR